MPEFDVYVFVKRGSLVKVEAENEYAASSKVWDMIRDGELKAFDEEQWHVEVLDKVEYDAQGFLINKRRSS